MCSPFPQEIPDNEDLPPVLLLLTHSPEGTVGPTSPVCVHVCLSVCVHIHACACVCVSVYAYACVCICVRTYVAYMV